VIEQPPLLRGAVQVKRIDCSVVAIATGLARLVGGVQAVNNASGDYEDLPLKLIDTKLNV
jgi:hypothetical protein